MHACVLLRCIGKVSEMLENFCEIFNIHLFPYPETPLSQSRQPSSLTTTPEPTPHKLFSCTLLQPHLKPFTTLTLQPHKTPETLPHLQHSHTTSLNPHYTYNTAYHTKLSHKTLDKIRQPSYNKSIRNGKQAKAIQSKQATHLIRKQNT